MRTAVPVALAAALAAGPALTTRTHADPQIDRGQYLVTLGSCNDCHTPGYFLGKPDMAQYLGGSDVAFELPGLGAFAGRNITPDRDTGIGDWTSEEIVRALQTGERPDGRILSPIMPWRAFANLTKEDAFAIAAFLKSIPPVRRAVAGPFEPGDNITAFLLRVLPPGATAAAAPKPDR